MSLQEIRRATHEWSERGEPWGEAILVSVRRSAPRPPGARFAAAVDGSMAGSISAGCVEADLREHVLQSVADGEPRLLTYGITDEMALGVGLSCGGEIEVLVRAHEPADPVQTELDRVLRAGTAGALATGISENVRGLRLLVEADGSSTGGFGSPSIDGHIAAAIRDLLAREGGRLLQMEDGSAVFVDALLPPRRLVIVGATPAASALARMASISGFRVIVVDPREKLARTELFPDAELVKDWPGEALAHLDLDPWTAVAVLSHDARLDLPALHQGLSAGCHYVGLLGGRRTQRQRRESLVSQGLSQQAVERIRGPIGLDIGAATPAEIAVAVLAEVVAVRRGAPAGKS